MAEAGEMVVEEEEEVAAVVVEEEEEDVLISSAYRNGTPWRTNIWAIIDWAFSLLARYFKSRIFPCFLST